MSGRALSGFDLCRAAMAVEGTTAPEQSVLLVLAVMANDDRQCWPGINGANGLTGKTKLSERTVQRAVQGLKDAGHISWIDKPGRGRVYVVHPRHSDTSNEATPVTESPRHSDTRHSDTPVTVTPTPVTVTPKQPRTTNNPQKATPSSDTRAALNRKAGGFGPPRSVTLESWNAFCGQRKKPLTEIAYHRILKTLAEGEANGWPPGELIDRSIENSWETVFLPREPRHGKRPANNPTEHQNPMFRAAFGTTGFGFAD